MRNIGLICLFVVGWGGVSYSPFVRSSGIVVVKYSAVSLENPGQKMTLADDSIFFYGNHAIEKVNGMVETEKDGLFTRIEKTKRLYFVDFNGKRFCEINTDFQPVGYPARKWKNFDSFKTGLGFHYGYYHGEVFTKKDSVVNGEKMSLVRYVSGEGIDQGGYFTIFLSPTTERPLLSANLEGAFHGKLRMIWIDTYLKNRSARAKICFEEPVMPIPASVIQEIQHLSETQ